MVMISLSTSPGCGPRFLAGWASSLSSRASQCGRNAWQKSSNWQKSSTSRSNIDASPHLMAPTQKEEFKGDKGLASPQTRNSGSSTTCAATDGSDEPGHDDVGTSRTIGQTPDFAVISEMCASRGGKPGHDEKAKCPVTLAHVRTD